MSSVDARIIEMWKARGLAEEVGGVLVASSGRISAIAPGAIRGPSRGAPSVTAKKGPAVTASASKPLRRLPAVRKLTDEQVFAQLGQLANGGG
jgi:hypothetical protein